MIANAIDTDGLSLNAIVSANTIISGDLTAVLIIISPEFRQFSNLTGLLRQATFNGLIAIGMTCVILSDGIDLSVGSNIALSMGMVGALSIVRFRTAVKDPLDTAYMFWALTMGILLGAEQYIIALVVVAGISVILFALNLFKFTSPNGYLLVLHYDEDAEYDINQQLRRSVKHRRLRSKTHISEYVYRWNNRHTRRLNKYHYWYSQSPRQAKSS